MQEDKKTIQVSFMELLKANGWRCTAQRLAILGIMQGNATHPSAESVWHEAQKELPSISLETVYRILSEFCQAGIFMKIENSEKVRFDGNPVMHGHFFCDVCDNVFDFPVESDYISSDCRASLGRITNEDVSLHGVCKACLNNE